MKKTLASSTRYSSKMAVLPFEEFRLDPFFQYLHVNARVVSGALRAVVVQSATTVCVAAAGGDVAECNVNVAPAGEPHCYACEAWNEMWALSASAELASRCGTMMFIRTFPSLSLIHI